jgi:hypothetical protein
MRAVNVRTPAGGCSCAGPYGHRLLHIMLDENVRACDHLKLVPQQQLANYASFSPMCCTWHAGWVEFQARLDAH